MFITLHLFFCNLPFVAHYYEVSTCGPTWLLSTGFPLSCTVLKRAPQFAPSSPVDKDVQDASTLALVLHGAQVSLKLKFFLTQSPKC